MHLSLAVSQDASSARVQDLSDQPMGSAEKYVTCRYKDARPRANGEVAHLHHRAV